MLFKKALLDSTTLNNAFLSKTNTAAQSVASTNLTLGGQITLKTGGSTFTDGTKLVISPLGDELSISDGVNNQQLSIYSSSGTEALQLTTINGTTSYSRIDVTSAVDHLELMTNTGKWTKFGGEVSIGGVAQKSALTVPAKGIQWGDSATATDNFHIVNDTVNGRGFRIYNGNYGSGTHQMTIQSGNVGIGTNAPAYRLDVTGDIRATGKIYANANGTSYFRGGDDVELFDVNIANTLGVYGVQDASIGSIKLGSGGAVVSGYSGNIGIANLTPAYKLDVSGNIRATTGLRADSIYAVNSFILPVGTNKYATVAP